MRKDVLAAAMLISGAAYAQQRPNVIIIYTDDHGTLDANCYGATDLYTPNINSLAAHGSCGKTYQNAPCSSFVTAPKDRTSASSPMNGESKCGGR